MTKQSYATTAQDQTNDHHPEAKADPSLNNLSTETKHKLHFTTFPPTTGI